MDAPHVAGLYISPQEGSPIEVVPETSAVAGAGLEGDRYWQGDKPKEQRVPSEEITLFAREAVDHTNARTDLGITYEDMRRNVMTSGVDLDALIGRRCRIGDVEIEVLEANPPCKHLQALAGKPLLKPMIDGGGVRGRIITGGTIRVGDEIVVADVTR